MRKVRQLLSIKAKLKRKAQKIISRSLKPYLARNRAQDANQDINFRTCRLRSCELLDQEFKAGLSVFGKIRHLRKWAQHTWSTKPTYSGEHNEVPRQRETLTWRTAWVPETISRPKLFLKLPVFSLIAVTRECVNTIVSMNFSPAIRIPSLGESVARSKILERRSIIDDHRSAISSPPTATILKTDRKRLVLPAIVRLTTPIFSSSISLSSIGAAFGRSSMSTLLSRTGGRNRLDSRDRETHSHKGR